MSRPRVVLLPGNGWADVRAEPARAALDRLGRPFELVVGSYGPGPSFEEMLGQLTVDLERLRPRVVHATGIGGLVALALRARGNLRSVPLVLQGPVLWGLERRRFPRLMRQPGMPRLLTLLFRSAAVRQRFAAKHFERSHSPDFLDRFFDGYRDPADFRRWFDWLTPSLLRSLEVALAARPGALDRVEAWWGDRDAVVGVEELRTTERALGVRIPLRTFPAWGHYPMIDAPEEWVREVAHGLEDAPDRS